MSQIHSVCKQWLQLHGHRLQEGQKTADSSTAWKRLDPHLVLTPCPQPSHVSNRGSLPRGLSSRHPRTSSLFPFPLTQPYLLLSFYLYLLGPLFQKRNSYTQPSSHHL